MSCPLCNRPMGMNVKFTCASCWPKLPAGDRQVLGSMLRRKVSTASKLSAVVRNMKAAEVAS